MKIEHRWLSKFRTVFLKTLSLLLPYCKIKSDMPVVLSFASLSATAYEGFAVARAKTGDNCSIQLFGRSARNSLCFQCSDSLSWYMNTVSRTVLLLGTGAFWFGRAHSREFCSCGCARRSGLTDSAQT